MSADEPDYYGLFHHTVSVVNVRCHEERVCELYSAILIRNPMSTMMRVPSDDLFHLLRPPFMSFPIAESGHLSDQSEGQ